MTSSEMQGASRAEQVYRPGEEVPESGVYMVFHEGHRPSHSATILKGEKFPACGRCGPAVKFALVRTARSIAEDFDFGQTPGTGSD